MRFFISLSFALFFVSNSFSQSTDNIGVWLDHLPYSKGVDIVQSGNVLYCATNQALFTYNLVDHDIQRISKANGLSDVNITAMDITEDGSQVIVGYDNANIDIVIGSEVYNMPDIRLSANYPGLKTINHLYVTNYNEKNLCYVSTDFGVVQIDLDRRIVEETFIIGPNGTEIKANAVVINKATDSIYCATENGLFKASMFDVLGFYDNWTRDASIGNQEVFHTTVFDDKVFVNTNANTQYFEDSVWVEIPSFFPKGRLQYLKGSKEALVISTNYSTEGYSTALFDTTSTQSVRSHIANYLTLGVPDSLFNPQAALVDKRSNSNLFFTLDGFKALYVSNFIGESLGNILPNAPASKNCLNMYYGESKLYVAPGAISPTYGSAYNSDGLFFLEDFRWTNLRWEDINKYLDIVAIVEDPNNPNRFYASSYSNGILVFEDGAFVEFLDQEKIGAENLPGVNNTPEYRIGDFAPDEEGNIWFSNSLSVKPIGVIRTDGSIESYSAGATISSSIAIKNIMYTSLGQIWIQTNKNGIAIASFVNGNIEMAKMDVGENQGNLPTEDVVCFVEDKDGEVWIGTTDGVAVLYSPANLFEVNRNFDAQPILLDPDGDGLGDPFLGGQKVNDIEVDGSNKKWFATAGSGVYYTTDDGSQTIYNFNTTNSPLPSNNVIDIEIDDERGMVYFGTDEGIVSYQGVATEGGETHQDVYAYPNPVEPGYRGPILIRGLVTNSQVKITDIEGNIVYETVAEGGQAIWSGNRFNGERVATGVYLAYCTDDLGTETTIAKILIVN